MKVFIIWSLENIDTILLQAQNLGMLQKGYTWIFSNSFQTQYSIDGLKINMYNSQLQNSIDGLIFFSYSFGIWDKYLFITEEYKNGTLDMNQKFIFDSVVSYGRAIELLIAENGNPQSGDDLISSLKRIDFLGATGRCKFQAVGERDSEGISIVNIVNNQRFEVSIWEYHKGMTIKIHELNLLGNTKLLPSNMPSFLSSENRWKLSPDVSLPPHKGSQGSLVSYTKKDQLILFGGKNEDQGSNNKIYIFDTKSNTWTYQVSISSDIPEARFVSEFENLNLGT